MTDIDGPHTADFVLGVDLGTSHTVAMLRHPDGRTRPLLFDGKPLLPSAVYLDTTGRLHVGADALRLGQAEPGRLEPHPKRHVDAGSVQLGETTIGVADLFAALLQAVAREAVAAAGLLPPAILTYPAAWGGPRRAVLTDALGMAGWPPGARLTPEPVAAARYFADVLRRPVPAGASIAVFDFGGGTLDVAVVRNEGPGERGHPRFSVTASGGADDLGGLDLDAALVDHLGKTLTGAEPEAWRRLTEPVTLAEWRARRQFWEDVRGAKEMLSRGSFAPVPVPGVEHAADLTRDELEAAIDPLVRRGVAEAATVLQAAGLRGPDLAGLFLVGGSSRVPMVARLLHAELGIAPTVLEQPELPVAEGAILASGAPSARVRFTPGMAGTATRDPAEPASGPPTLPDSPPPLTDTRAEAAAVPDPPTPVPAARAPEDVTDERLRSEPVDPWATGEAAALAAGGHLAPPLTPVSPPPGQVSSPPPVATSPPPFGAHQPPGAHQPHAGHPQNGHQPGARQPGGHPHAGSRQHGGQHNGGYPNGGYPQGEGWSPPQQQRVAQPGRPHEAAPHAQPGGWAPGATTPEAARARRGLGKRSYVVIAAAVTLTLAAGTALAWYFWGGSRAIDYRPLSEPTRIAAIVPVSSDWADAEILGDRVYFASSNSSSGAVGVVAMRRGESKPLWTASTAIGTAKGGWRSMIALPVGVALFSETNYDTSTRRLVVLGADGGGSVLWERTFGNQDLVLFAGGTAVIADREGHRLVGLRLSDGKERWSLADPETTYRSDTNVVAVTTPADLDGPATVFGRPYQPNLTDDPRIVQIAADKSARVINADTGKIVASRQNVAAPNDEVIAHNGRLIVLQPDDKQIFSYDLGKFAEPKVLYTVRTPDSQMKYVAPCGDDRVCFDEEVGYDGKSATVVALNAADGGKLWSYPLADTESIVPVGESLLVSTGNGEMTLLDPAGHKIWTRTGEAARLDAGNIIEFSKPLSRSTGETALYGRHIGDDAVPLGSLLDTRADTCSWDKTTLACVADKDFILQTFAE